MTGNEVKNYKNNKKYFRPSDNVKRASANTKCFSLASCGLFASLFHKCVQCQIPPEKQGGCSWAAPPDSRYKFIGKNWEVHESTMYIYI